MHTLCCGEQALCSEQACPALGCAAAPKPITAECLAIGIPQYWGRFAAQRRASLLTTISLLTAVGLPTTIKLLTAVGLPTTISLLTAVGLPTTISLLTAVGLPTTIVCSPQ